MIAKVIRTLAETTPTDVPILIRDWRRDLGDYGNVHVRLGKGSPGRGYTTRLVAAINPGAGSAGLVDG